MIETMDAFGDDFTGVSEVADVDPAAEFLAREHDQLAGLEDLIPEVSQPEHVETIQGLLITCLSVTQLCHQLYLEKVLSQ
jgi:hypothetical protein